MFLPGLQILHQSVAELGAALAAAERVQLQADIDAELGQQHGRHGDHFGIHPGVVGAKHLGVQLVELAQPPLLGPFVPKHRPDGVEALDGPVHIEPMFYIGTNQGGCPLGPHGDTLVDEGVHLLFDDIRRLADGAGEQLRLLQDRHADLGELEPGENVPGRRLNPPPYRDIRRQYIFEPVQGL